MTSHPATRLRRRLTVVVIVLLGMGLLPFLPAAIAVVDPLKTSDLGRFEQATDFALDTDTARVAPKQYVALEADLKGLRADLAKAPAEESRGATPARVTLPGPDGKPVEFAVVRVPVMDDELAAQHPEITAYAGRQVGDRTTSVALDLGPNGFHAAVRDLGGRSWFVDPAYNRIGETTHLSYFADALPADERGFVERELVRSVQSQTSDQGAGEAPGAEVMRRTYRLALVTDPNYATYFAASDVLAEKAALVNRVNQIYNEDLAVRLILANGSDALNLATAAEATDANGPCGASACYTEDLLASCSSDLLDRNTFAIGQIIGADEYDIGHIALGGGGGGIAGLAVVGHDRKAAGCTGLDTPDGDFFAIDFVAHEMGHQFNGEHTFNGANGSCAPPNRWGPSAVEVGSGSSVMAYAGICFSDDLQPHTDPYFSQQSIDEITTHVTGPTEDYAEVQTVTLRSFDTDGDSFTLSFPGGIGPNPTFTRGPTYTTANVQTALQVLTGAAVTVTGYDGASGVGDNGFTVTWPLATVNPPRLAFAATTGGVTGFTGVQIQGGASTNQGVADATGNHAPTVDAGPDKTIPLQTPFLLSGSATDTDDDDLIYLWEQDDPGFYLTGLEAGDPLTTTARTSGPLFRVFGDDAVVTPAAALEYESDGENLADGNPARSFPDMAQILAGNTNAETGGCVPEPFTPDTQLPNDYLDCQSELLPTPLYTNELSFEMHFRLTARDLFPGGGGVQHDDVVLTVGDAGPFLVTSRGTAGTPATPGATEDVTWDAAGTNSATYAENVRISLSTDGGVTWTELVASTPNDGSHTVTWPDVATTTARVKVEAVDNYFFDVNDADFAIGSTSPNTAPVARIKASPKVVIAGSPVSLSAAKSSDAQTPGDLTYEWDFGNQGRKVDATTEQATAKYGKRGFRTATLTVTDPQGLSDTAKVNIQVRYRKDCEAEGVFRTSKWRTLTRKSALGGRYCATGTNATDERMRSSFSGDAIRIDYATAQPGGKAKVFVDNVRVGTLSFEGNSRKPKFTSSATFRGFGKGGHFVKIVVIRGAAYVDTFSF